MKTVLIDTVHQSDFKKIQKDVFLKKEVGDSLQYRQELQQELLRLNSNGYSGRELRQHCCRQHLLQCLSFLGTRYEWASLDAGNVDEEFLSKTGYRSKIFDHQPIRYDQVRQLEEKF